MEKPYELIQSETTYRGRVFNVRRDEVRLPDERLINLDVVDHNGAVTVVPVDDANEIWFVRQYRHPAGSYLLELPAGTLDDDEPPELCAQREIREEIGMAAGRLDQIGAFFLAPGYSTEFMVVYLARDLRLSPLQQDIDEFLSVVKIPVEQTYKMALNGHIQDAKSLAALLLARPHLLIS